MFYNSLIEHIISVNAKKKKKKLEIGNFNNANIIRIIK